jgi:hypothetical protein
MLLNSRKFTCDELYVLRAPREGERNSLCARRVGL